MGIEYAAGGTLQDLMHARHKRRKHIKDDSKKQKEMNKTRNNTYTKRSRTTST